VKLLKQSGEYLIKVSNTPIVDKIRASLLSVDTRWNRLVQSVKEKGASQQRDGFESGIAKLGEWIDSAESCITTIGKKLQAEDLKEHFQQIEV